MLNGWTYMCNLTNTRKINCSIIVAETAASRTTGEREEPEKK
jgi:hypothetical protein